jgi:hypothetical protein
MTRSRFKTSLAAAAIPLTALAVATLAAAASSARSLCGAPLGSNRP